ncbi:MAG: penicillin-binding protein 2 [Verrucomicrobiae bacterium]|nr:penicillin-binding protein 2 [Verrucomicrobiae bacterium]
MPTRCHRFRVLLLAAAGLLVLAALGVRLYRLQVVHHEELKRLADRQIGRRILLPARRGTIADCNGNVLAHTVARRLVSVDPKAIAEIERAREKKKRPSTRAAFARILADQLALPYAEVEEKLARDSRYVVLARKEPADAVERLQAALAPTGLLGALGFADDPERLYPNGSLMSHVLGYVDAEQRGVNGVERVMQADLRGEDGWRAGETDNRGREIVAYRREDFPSRDGYTVVLALDQAVQDLCEQELDRAVAAYRPDSAVAIVMRPATGEILALASRPTFNPNDPDKQVDSLRNRAVSDLNEPGSTFKVVTVAAALDQRLVTLNDVIFCENGRFEYAGRELTDHQAYGNLTVAEILAHSVNIGAAKIALKLGKERMYAAMRCFGFGERAFGDRPTEAWPGEVRGIVHPPRQWSQVSITRVAMGHEVGVTPIQTIGAVAAVANGGNLMQPLIIRRVLDEKGVAVREFFPKVRRRVMDPRAARELTEALKRVVSQEGTAAKAAIPGFQVAGKTGTAQKLVNGRYVHDRHVSSFVGFFPAEDPEICIYVMLDAPKGKVQYGGSVAAPVFREIGLRVASYLNLRPTVPVPVGAPPAAGASLAVSSEGDAP